ncbi:2'-5' RNA ligase [Prosthecobacter debontii]|uniref:2'-5' RNA ligase n=1 Tax=Prosthecobacter debontii TaxID=48467 RepID=A0A1T4XIK7_9BACT|nr:2'-5' RNA ligase family protein [Prosthecobacter debontii]SKA89337.1 2'-5' RNA ligase [Prosthecobacter debontii]
MSRSNLDYAYFIALLPDAAAKQQIHEHYEKLGLNLRLRPDDVFHITLNDLGDRQPFELPLHITETVDRACRHAAAATAPFHVALDRVLSFKHNRALALMPKLAPNSELKAFRRTLRLKLLDHGVSTPSSFNPHLTLLYGDHRLDKSISPSIS